MFSFAHVTFITCVKYHRSDSNKSSDYIAIFLSLISSFYEQHFKISNVQSVEKYFFYPTKDIDVGHTKQEMSLFKILPFVSSDYIAFCYFQFLKFFLNITGISIFNWIEILIFH